MKITVIQLLNVKFDSIYLLFLMVQNNSLMIIVILKLSQLSKALQELTHPDVRLQPNFYLSNRGRAGAGGNSQEATAHTLRRDLSP